MIGEPRRYRRLRGRLLEGLCLGSAALAVAALGWVVGYVVVRGLAGLDLALFTQLPAPAGQPGGGMGNAMLGSLLILAIATALSLPLGVAVGIHLAESARPRLAGAIRFLADVLAGVPSIVLGILGYALIVAPMRHFSALAGGAALAALMLPPIARATEEALRLVPRAEREAALALGIPRWRATLSVVLPAAVPGLTTGAMLALARAAGETAPLLFTAFGNAFWSVSPLGPMAALPLQIYQYAISPYDDWRRQAWAGALVLVAAVALLGAAARLATRASRPDR